MTPDLINTAVTIVSQLQQARLSLQIGWYEQVQALSTKILL